MSSEYVFENGKMISRLDWKQYASPVMNASATLSFFGAFVRCSVLSALPMKCGSLDDFDFLLAGSSLASQYSHHSVYLDKRFDFCAETGYAFTVGRYTLSPYAGVLYRMQKWAAYDGYLQYPTSGAWTGAELKQQMSGNIISYEQSLLLPQLSFRAACAVSETWHITAWFSAVPYAVVNTLDSHFLRSKQFFDSLRGGFGFSAGAAVSYKKFSASVLYEWLSIKDGTTHSSAIGNTAALMKDTSTPGVKNWLITVRVSYTF
ncbi:MAG: omptin family outer membrane protease [Treponema sp.]|nr:omptin family outer membrane protease [Treponema sp.]